MNNIKGNAIFSVVIVLYKKHYSDSIAISTLLLALGELKKSFFNFKIYVWNNSPECSPAFDHPMVTWLEGNNSTLPYIYNTVSEMAFSSGSVALMLSDDDTDYSTFDFQNNLSILNEHLFSNSSKLVGCYIPQISSSDKLVSPGKRFLFKGYLLRSVSLGMVSSKNLLAINSGVIVTQDCYERIKPLYDPRLNFYGTDTDFFVRYEEVYEYVYVLDCVINHSLSEHTKESVDRVFFRWKDNFYAVRLIFDNKSRFFRGAMCCYHFLLKTKLAVKYRDLRFMKI